MSGLQNSISLLGILSEAEEKGCPLPTQNIDLNLKNRNIAFKKMSLNFVLFPSKNIPQ